jgi:hypothetical protein
LKVKVKVQVKAKVKFTLEQAMKAQRGSRGIAILSLRSSSFMSNYNDRHRL